MKKSWAITLLAMFIAVPAFAGWRTTLETEGSSDIGLAQSAVFFSRNTQDGRIDILSCKHEDGWHEEVVAGGFPEYPFSGEELEVEHIRNHSLVDTPNGLYASVVGQYNNDISAIFLKFMDGQNSNWIRVTPVAEIYVTDITVDDDGLIWFAWLVPVERFIFQVHVSSYNPETGETMEPEIVTPASERENISSVQIVSCGRELWAVSGSANSGVNARMRRSDGAWVDPIHVTDAHATTLDATYALGTLWIVLRTNNGELYRLDGQTGNFVIEQTGMFHGFKRITDLFMIALFLGQPVFEVGNTETLRVVTDWHFNFETGTGSFELDTFGLVVWQNGKTKLVSKANWFSGLNFASGRIARCERNEIVIIEETGRR